MKEKLQLKAYVAVPEGREEVSFELEWQDRVRIEIKALGTTIMSFPELKKAIDILSAAYEQAQSNRHPYIFVGRNVEAERARNREKQVAWEREWMKNNIVDGEKLEITE